MTLFKQLPQQSRNVLYKRILNYNYKNALTIGIRPDPAQYRNEVELVQVRFSYRSLRDDEIVPLEIAHPVQYLVSYSSKKVFFFNVLDTGVFRNFCYDISGILEKPASTTAAAGSSHEIKEFAQEIDNQWNFQDNGKYLLTDFTLAEHDLHGIFVIWGVLYDLNAYYNLEKGTTYEPIKSGSVFKLSYDNLRKAERVVICHKD